MKLKTWHLIVPCFLLLISTAYAEDGYGEIRVIVEGLSNNKGLVKIGLYNSKASYLSKGTIPSFRSSEVTVINGKAETVFTRVPFAEYTIKAYHDDNANGRLDLGFLGIPKEQYGFSNNPRKTLGLPDYEKVKFSLSSKELVLEINLR